MASSNLFIGLMSGTSMDGVDAVLAEVTSSTANVIGHAHCDYPPALLSYLHQLCTSGEHEIDALGVVENGVAEVFSHAVEKLLTETHHCAEQITAIGSHGPFVTALLNGQSIRMVASLCKWVIQTLLPQALIFL